MATLNFKGKNGYYSCHLGGEYWGYVIFGIVHYPGDRGIYLQISVSIANEEIERIKRTLWGRTGLNTAASATCGTGLGYIMPEATYKTWYVDYAKPDSIKATVEEVIQNIELFGLPFMKHNADLQVLAKLLRRRADMDPSRMSLPIILVLLGQTRRACQIVEKEKNRFEREGYDTFYFIQFAKNFLKKYCRARAKVNEK